MQGRSAPGSCSLSLPEQCAAGIVQNVTRRFCLPRPFKSSAHNLRPVKRRQIYARNVASTHDRLSIARRPRTRIYKQHKTGISREVVSNERKARRMQGVPATCPRPLSRDRCVYLRPRRPYRLLTRLLLCCKQNVQNDILLITNKLI